MSATVAFSQRGALRKGNTITEKSLTLNLHITARDVELLGPRPRQVPEKFFDAPTGESTMKRLMILTIIAVTMVATSGCCRTRSFFRWGQGDACSTCSSGIGAYETGPIYEGSILPPPSVLPGPDEGGN